MSDFASIRAKYPQYDDLSDEALAKGLHAKHYSDMPYEDFAAKVGLTAQPAAPQAPKEPPSLMERVAGANLKLNQMKEAGKAGIGNAVTFGFMDEAAGLIGGDDAKESVRNYMGEMRERNPASFIAGEVGAGIASAPIAAGTRAAQIATKAPKTVAAVTGGLYGAGNAEGNALERAPQTGIGAAAGVGGQIAVSALSKPVANLFGKLLNRTTPNQKVNLTRPQRKALGKFRDAARADGYDFDERIAELAREGLENDALVFEKFGPEVEKLAVGMAADSGPARSKLLDTLTERQARQRPFVAARLKEIVKADEFSTATDKLSESFKKVGSPLYKKVLPQPVEITPRLGQILQRDGMDEVMRKAAANANREGRKLDPNTVDFLHTVKLAVDDKVTGEARSNGQRAASNSWKAISDALVEEIEAQAPDYRIARQYWAGAKADETALAYGRKALNPSVDTEDIAAEVARMSESEKAFFKAGLFRAARQKIVSKTEGGNAAGAFNRLDVEEKFRAALDPEEADEAFKLFDDIAGQTKIRRAVDNREGSPTQLRQEAREVTKTRLGKALDVVSPDRAGAAVATGGQSEVANGLKALLARGSRMDDATKTAIVDLLISRPQAVQSLSQSQSRALTSLLSPQQLARIERAAAGSAPASAIAPQSAFLALTSD